jgi:hypothetical protein
VDKLERVASEKNSHIACRVYRPKQYQNDTHFLFGADFVDGTKWDIIVPHFEFHDDFFAPLQASRRNSTSTGLLRASKQLPKVKGLGISSKNEAGIPFVFIESIFGKHIEI